MASPIDEGSMASSPFINRNVDIIKEKLLIIPGTNFETTQFFIEYHIQAKKAGTQIPLLFYAYEFEEGFKVWVDDVEILLNPVPDRYQKLEGTPFDGFSHFFDSGDAGDTNNIDLDSNSKPRFIATIDDLKFFEIDLTKGIHVIRVEYVAGRWTDHSDWVNEYSFRYALSPAKYWKSFGSLEITLDASNFRNKLSTNLGTPTKGTLLSQASWTFTEIPVDVLRITYQPEIPSAAKTLIAISPMGLTIILGVILILIHLILIWLYRRKNPGRKFSWVVIAGSLIIPLITLIGYMVSFGIIDSIIGRDAGHYHGYTFMILIFYPIILPVYWTAMWLVDRLMKRRNQKQV